MHRVDDLLSPHEDLDELIRRALDKPAEDVRIARLERSWQRSSQRDWWRRRVVRLGAWAAAAAAVITMVMIAQSRRSDRDVPQQADATDGPLSPVEEETPVELAVVDATLSLVDSRSAGRPPTAYERFLFVARTQTRLPLASPTVESAVDGMVARLSADPNADVQRVWGEAGLDGRNAEAMLLRKLSRSNDDDERAIARLLAVCGTRRAVPALLELGRRDAFRDDVLAAVEAIVGLDRLADVAVLASDEPVRLAILRRLFTADSESALRGYLSLAADKLTRNEALAVARDSPAPPIDELLALVDDDEKEVRLTAAIVLSTVNGPEVTRSLIARVTAQPADSTEAWIALVGCRGELAEEFFAYAMQRPRLLGYFNGARLRWAQMIP